MWDYINKFTEFNNYRHQVLTKHKGKVFQMPINLETINSLYKRNFTPLEARKHIQKESKKRIGIQFLAWVVLFGTIIYALSSLDFLI